jgi:phosphodiesterase/alkaline phosphatase D-like protein
MPAINNLKMSSGIIMQQLTASQKFYYRFSSSDANAPNLTIYLVGYVLDI